MTDREGDRPGATADLVFAGLAAIAVVTLLWLARDTTFRGDDWDLVANRSLLDPIGLLRPFNEQWIVVPALIFRAIFTIVGMHSYLPYLVVLLALHVLVAVRVRALAIHASGVLLGTAAGVVILFLGIGNENLGQAFQIGMVLATAAGIWAIDVLATQRRPAAAAVLLLVALGSHAVAAAFLGACLLVAVSHRSRRELAWMFVPAGVLVAWLVLFDLPSMSARGGSFASAVVAVPAFVVQGIVTAIGAVLGLSPVAGVAILAVLVVLAWIVARRPSHGILAGAVISGLALEYALVAISRAEFGIESVLWSRYLYVAVPLVLIAVVAWFGDGPERAGRRDGRVVLVVVALATLAVAGNLRYYLAAREITLDFVDRTRAAVAVADWATDITTWDQDLHLPPPGDLRRLVAEHGSPARDDLLPWIVPEVPAATADEICRQLVPDPNRRSACVAAVADRVGGR